MVTVTIDGRTVQVPAGTPIIEAAKQAGIRIPHYCYHPALSVVGSCRMCLVEIEKNPKLQPACATGVTEGMVIKTQTPETIKNRRAVLEFLLLNHPLDCPVCDQAGECELQNYYMEYGLYDPRFNENKTKRKKAYPIGRTIILDQERCILCTRCVRFSREISRTCELGVINRGHRSEIDILPGFEVNNSYSGNLADICPVGALTDRDFRFKCRVWFLGGVPSICPGCSRGCNIEIHFNAHFNPRYHDQRILRLKPRYNKEVNGYWICDEGRYGYHSIDAADRLVTPAIRQLNGYRRTSWDEAIHEAASALKRTLASCGAEAVGILASPQMSNEELFLLRNIFVEQLNIRNIAWEVPFGESVFSDDFLITADKNPNTEGARYIIGSNCGSQNLLQECVQGRIRWLYIFGHDLQRNFDRYYVSEAMSRPECVVFQGSWNQATAAMAHIQFPAAVYAEKEGTFTNCQGRVQRFQPAVSPLGESLPDLEILRRLARQLDISVPMTAAAEVFAEIGRNVEAFGGMTYQSIGNSGQLLRSKTEK